MIFRVAISSIIYLICSFTSRSQEIYVGQTLPEITLTGVLNYHSDTMKIADLKRKLIILDFWNHHCTSCLESFPKLDSLQRLFKDQIQIILVNRESKNSTIEFFRKKPKIKNPDLIMVTGDEQLSQLFPVDGYPFCVWLDSSKIVRYFSWSSSLHAKSIRKFLSSEELHFVNPTTVEFGSPFSHGQFEYYSYLSKCQPARYIGNVERSIAADTNYIHISSACASIVELFLKAYEEKGKHKFSTFYGLNFQTPDSLQYFRPSNDELLEAWRVNNSYNYELYLPRSRMQSAYTIMQEDLERYFPIQAKIEYRPVVSAVLRVVDEKWIKTKGGVPVNTMTGPGYGAVNANKYRSLINQPFSLLSTYLRLLIRYDYPFYDEAQLPLNIDIRFREESISPINFEKINEDLKQSGLRLDLEERMCPVLHLKRIE